MLLFVSTHGRENKEEEEEEEEEEKAVVHASYKCADLKYGGGD